MLKKIFPIFLCLLLLSSCANPLPENTDRLVENTPQIVSPSTPPSFSPTPQTPTPTPLEPTPTSIATKSSITASDSSLVEYDGPIYHIFYHFLIAFPDIAYADSYGAYLDQVCVTPGEYWRSLEELYKNDFVLMNLNDSITVDESGKVIKNKLYLPEGKKPLVISFDDINYYSANHGKGICDKIILDNNGNFAMSTMQDDGSDLITYDNGVVPLLEKFCKENPDFSPFGAKGLLAITGYDGILGYRIQRDSPNRESELQAVTPVVDALKSAGWYFGSHSYGHIHSQKASLNRVEEDTLHWDTEVKNVVGDTQIYVFPYGEYTQHSDARFEHLLDDGFKILCGVGMPDYFKTFDQYAFMDRKYIDGNAFRLAKKWLDPLMNVDYVYSPTERHEK